MLELIKNKLNGLDGLTLFLLTYITITYIFGIIGLGIFLLFDK